MLAELPPWLLYGFTALLGAVMASFAGVVAQRLPHQIGWRDDSEEGVNIAWPPSRCDGCHRRLSVIDLIPVIGWIASRGRCRKCDVRVSPTYPIVEAASAFVSVAIVWWLGVSAEAGWLLIIFWSCIALTWMDITDHLLASSITIPLFWLGLLLSPWEPDPYLRILGALTACSAIWLSFAVTGAVKRLATMSGGDIALAAAGGAWVGFDNIQFFLLATCVIYLLYAVPLRFLNIVWVPMGPALCASLLLVPLLAV